MKRRGREVTRSSLTLVQWPALWVCRSISLLRWQLRGTVVVTYWIWLIRLRPLTLILLVSGCLWCHVQGQLGITAECWDSSVSVVNKNVEVESQTLKKSNSSIWSNKSCSHVYVLWHSGSKSSLYFSLTLLLQEVWNVFSSNSQKYSLVLRKDVKFSGWARHSDFPEYTVHSSSLRLPGE